jgi:adenylyl-sulfate kinase
MSKGFVIWFTGLSGSGKSTLTTLVAAELRRRAVHVETLDGDEIRRHLSKGLGFSKEDRDVNIRRIAFVAKLVSRSGGCAITAAISPYREIRDEARRSVERFCEVFCDCPLSVLAERDPKGLYKKAMRGEIKNFTGVDDPYERPVQPDVYLDTSREAPETSAAKIVARLEELGFIPAWTSSRAVVSDTGGELTPPHGGELVDRVLRGQAAAEAQERAVGLPAVTLDEASELDALALAVGAYSPLTGFLGPKDYLRVVRERRLEVGLPWSLPITLRIDQQTASALRGHAEATLHSRAATPLGVLSIHEIWHPESAAAELLVHGDVQLFPASCKRVSSPSDVRAQARERGWRRVVAFPTRELPTRAHEYAMRCALEFADGVIVQLPLGARSVPLEVQRDCFDILRREYFAEERILITTSPGLRGAESAPLLDAIVAKNYGATHLIVPRTQVALDGSTIDCLGAFAAYSPTELGLELMPIGRAFWSERVGGFATDRTASGASNGGESDQELLRSLGSPAGVISRVRPEIGERLRRYLAERGEV